MKLASFETITEILPIEGADKIEIARVQGWQSVIRKGEYKVGDQVIFVPIDTVLTPRPWNEFLWDKKDPSKPIRVKTVKLKGVISSGLIFPKSLVSAQEIYDHMDDSTEDTSIAGMLGITKYEKPIPAHLAGQVAGDFPTHLLSKTDEDNLKSNIEVLEELREADYVEATDKEDGTSATYIKELDGTFRVCSRNMELKDTETNVYWQMARKYNLKEDLKAGYAIQGEIVGPGIQGNPAGYEEVDLIIFNVIDLSTRRPIWQQRYGNIEIFGRNKRTVQFAGGWNKKEFQSMTIDDLQEFVNKRTYINGKPCEGMVFRGYKKEGVKTIPMYSQKLQKMLSVKIINQYYKD
jgi:RNA ligase (TIGR02306 family)